VRIPKLRYHSGQQAVAAQIRHGLKYGVRSFVWQAGRRTGKTVMSNDILLHAMLAGKDVGIFIPTYKDGEKTFDWFSETLGGKKSPLVRSISKVMRTIRLHTGGTLDMWSMEKEGSGRGMKYDIINVDEGAKVKNLKSQLSESVGATITDTDGWMLITSTPRGVGNHFNQLFVKGQTPNPTIMSFRTPSYANPYLKKETLMLRKLELERDGELWVWQQEYLAIPAEQGVNPFTERLIASQIQKTVTNEPVIAWAIDLAIKVDFTVVIGFDKDCKIAQFYRWQTPTWPETEEKIIRILSRYPNAPAIMDATGSGSACVDYVARRGFNIVKNYSNQKNKPIMMREYRIALKRGNAWILEGQMLKEVRKAEYEEKKKDLHIFVPMPEHDDCLITGAMGTKLLNRLGYPRQTYKRTKRKNSVGRNHKHLRNLKRY